MALHRAPKDLIAALRTNIARLFVSNPFFRAELASVRYGPKDNLLAYRHGEVVDAATREFIAFMAPRVSFLFCAVPDLTLATMHESLIRKAAATSNVFFGQGFAVGERAFAGSSPPVKVCQQLLQLGVVVAMGNVDGADTAVKTAGRNEIGICRHGICSFDLLIYGVGSESSLPESRFMGRSSRDFLG
jgi:hypothetical protein